MENNNTKIIKEFRKNFPTKEQVTKQVKFGVGSWDFTDYFNEKLEELSTELWEDGYSFGIYKIKEMVDMAVEAVLYWLDNGTVFAMNKFNKKKEGNVSS